jgi:hypothetical protein
MVSNQEQPMARFSWNCMWIKVIICCWDERIGNDASYI